LDIVLVVGSDQKGIDVGFAGHFSQAMGNANDDTIAHWATVNP
jgi:hypothetical protein